MLVVKLTVDSTEPLEDVLRVLGALYDVELVIGTGRIVMPGKSGPGQSGGPTRAIGRGGRRQQPPVAATRAHSARQPLRRAPLRDRLAWRLTQRYVPGLGEAGSG